MKCFPEYAMNIIVGVQHQGRWGWYITEKEVWFLDYIKWSEAYGEGTEELGQRWLDDDYCVYFPIVDEKTAPLFLEAIRDYRVETEELRECMMVYIESQADYNEMLDLNPALFVDFDNRKFYSNFPEPASFEYFVPDGWIGIYDTFDQYVPENERYWVIDNFNVWLALKCTMTPER
jgi:hypothetical protein